MLFYQYQLKNISIHLYVHITHTPYFYGFLRLMNNLLITALIK